MIPIPHIFISNEYIQNHVVNKYPINNCDINELTHTKHQYAVVLSGFGETILEQFNNVNTAYFDLIGKKDYTPCQKDIIERLRILRPRFKFLRKLVLSPHELLPENLTVQMQNYVTEINNRAMLDGKKRYN